MTRKFCRRPFEWIETQGKNAYLCCPGWTDLPGIPVRSSSTVDEIWNSPTAQAFRKSILDGSFRYCSSSDCPYLNDQDMPYWDPQGSPVSDIDQVTDKQLLEVIDQQKTELDFGPRIWNCGHDRTCNLSCPSCRTTVIGLKKHQVPEVEALQSHLFTQLEKGLHTMSITGTGDPFSSQVYRKLLRDASAEKYPHIGVYLHTNAQLWTPQAWETIAANVKYAHISIDAACAEIYAINRRGGDWDTLMENLAFVSALRKSGRLKFVTISFVVQKNNFQEMPAFVELGEKFGFDLILFTPIRNWGTYNAGEYHAVHIASDRHIDFEKLKQVLRHRCFENGKVSIGRLAQVRRIALEESSAPVLERAARFCHWHLKRAVYRIQAIVKQRMPAFYQFLKQAKASLNQPG